MPTFLNVGVDVAKDAVVVACAEQRFPVQSVPNQRAPLRAWLKSLPAGSRIGLESTGAYHELLADLAQAQGYTVFLLNPLETRHYAKAMGIRAKTDRVDAELIARLIAQEHTRLRAYTPPTANQRKLDRLIRRRATIVRLQGTLKLTMDNLGGFAAELKTVMGKLDALIAKIDATMAALAACSPQHQEAQQRVETIVGVGPVVGISLTNTLERIPFRKRMRSWLSLAWIRGRMTRDTKPGADGCPNAAPPSCAACCFTPRCRPSKPKSGNRSTSLTALKAGARLPHW
jgi:transposase